MLAFKNICKNIVEIKVYKTICTKNTSNKYSNNAYII